MTYNPDLIITDANISAIRAWAISSGIEPVRVHAMNAVQLANLYHAQGPGNSPTDAQRIAADATLAALAMTPHAPQIDLEIIRDIVREELERVAPKRIEIVGPRGSIILPGTMHYATPQVLRAVGRGHPVMMVGPAGCGKTTIGEHVAQALQLPFYITSTINDTHELTGYMDGYGVYHATAFRIAFETGGVWIADEIDAWDASALLAANSALANGFATFPDNSSPVARHANFRMVATANTFGAGADRVYVGRNELDAASLDRFATINVDYDLDLERMFANGADKWLNHVWKIRKAIQAKKIRHVVSSRCITMGAAALADGEKWKAVEEMYLWKGLSAADRSKVNA